MARRPTLRSIRFDLIASAVNTFLDYVFVERVQERMLLNEAVNKEAFAKESLC